MRRMARAWNRPFLAAECAGNAAGNPGRECRFSPVNLSLSDPAKGSISHVSPLARALIGKRVGDTVRAGKDDAEITAIG